MIYIQIANPFSFISKHLRFTINLILVVEIDYITILSILFRIIIRTIKENFF